MLSAAVLAGMGVVFSYSATLGLADVHSADRTAALWHHLVCIAIGACALVAGATVDYRCYRNRRVVYAALFVAVVALAGLFVPGMGVTAGNSTRWYRVLGFSIQPAELAKLVFVVFLAYSLERKQDKIHTISIGLLPHLIVLGCMALLILMQPDLGTCIILCLIMLAMLFTAGARVGVLVVIAMGLLPVAAHIVANSWNKLKRILAFLDPWEYRYDHGFQIVNALITMGSGGLWGMGAGDGRQKMGGFLPEANTDFVLSVIGEELGFVGVALIAEPPSHGGRAAISAATWRSASRCSWESRRP
jgi:cell division protein FtsW